MELGRNLAVGGGCVVGNKLYFSNRTFNGLFEFDLKTDKLSFVCFFEGEDYDKVRLHNKCIQNDRSLIFIPDFGEIIHIYDLDVKEQRLIKIPSKVGKHRTFSDAILYKNELWLFPFSTKQKLLKVDLFSFQVKEIDTFYSECEEKGVYFKEILSYNAVQKEEKVYLVVNASNMIICWDMEKEKIEKFSVKVKNLLGIFEWGERFFLVAENDNSIYDWDVNGKLKKIYGNSNMTTKRPYRFILEREKIAYVIPCNSNRIIEINNLNNSYREIKYPKEIKRFIEKEEVKFIFSCKYEKKELLFPCTYDYFIILDNEKDYLTVKKWDFDNDINKAPLQSVIEAKAIKVIRNNTIVKEDKKITLDIFIKELKRL